MAKTKNKKVTQFRQRLAYLMEMHEYIPHDLEQKAGLYNGQIGVFLSGKTEPTLKTLQKLLKVFNEVQAEWLIMGTGKMHK